MNAVLLCACLCACWEDAPCLRLSCQPESTRGVSKEDIVAAVEQNLVNERTGGSRFKMRLP